MTHPNTTLESLAERGSPRGATAVLSGARQAAVRHRRRRAMAGSTALAVVLTSAVGATVYLSPDDEIRPLGGGSGAPPPTGGPQTLTGITVEGHEGFDRIVLQFNVDEVDIRGNAEYSGFAPGAECEDFDPLSRPGSLGAAFSTILSAPASGDDGLAPGLADTPVAGDTTYTRDVTVLCNVDGYAWLAIAEKPPAQGGVIRGPDFDAENPRLITNARCQGDAPGQVYIDVYERERRPPGTCAPSPQ
jgi:hypothetical protein